VSLIIALKGGSGRWPEAYNAQNKPLAWGRTRL